MSSDNAYHDSSESGSETLSAIVDHNANNDSSGSSSPILPPIVTPDFNNGSPATSSPIPSPTGSPLTRIRVGTNANNTTNLSREIFLSTNPPVHNILEIIAYVDTHNIDVEAEDDEGEEEDDEDDFPDDGDGDETSESETDGDDNTVMEHLANLPDEIVRNEIQNESSSRSTSPDSIDFSLPTEREILGSLQDMGSNATVPQPNAQSVGLQTTSNDADISADSPTPPIDLTSNDGTPFLMFTCVFCSKPPVTRILQCRNGHLLCSSCFVLRLNYARLVDEALLCPICTIELTKNTVYRNLIAESNASFIPKKCMYCEKKCTLGTVEKHESENCLERSTQCRAWRIGCQWYGTFRNKMKHESSCEFMKMSGKELLPYVNKIREFKNETMRLTRAFIEILKREKPVVNDIALSSTQCRGYSFTEDFYSCDLRWAILTKPNHDNPYNFPEREIFYKLVLKTVLRNRIYVGYCIVPSTYAPKCDVFPAFHKKAFDQEETESDYKFLPLRTHHDVDKVKKNPITFFRVLLYKTGV